MKATWHGQVIAESDKTIEVDGYTYFPRATVHMQLLSAAEKTKSDLECPHGVRFYDVVDGDDRSKRAAWSYESPNGSMKKVDHWLSFWEDVEIVP
jgi:uncharacterized protein (DUF427 family)